MVLSKMKEIAEGYLG